MSEATTHRLRVQRRSWNSFWAICPCGWHASRPTIAEAADRARFHFLRDHAWEPPPQPAPARCWLASEPEPPPTDRGWLEMEFVGEDCRRRMHESGTHPRPFVASESLALAALVEAREQSPQPAPPTRWHEDDLIGRMLKRDAWTQPPEPCEHEETVDVLMMCDAEPRRRCISCGHPIDPINPEATPR